MRPVELMAVLEREFASVREGHHAPVMPWGPPGVGKSRMIAQVAARHRAPVIDVRLSQMEPSDPRGNPFRVGDLVEWAIPALLPVAAYRSILDRRLGECRVSDGWVIFAAGNRQGDRAVGQGLFEAPQFAIWAKSIADVMLFES